jgi:hypothetical protein
MLAKLLSKIPKGKGIVGRPRQRKEENIKMYRDVDENHSA